jgi:hypothetical protein
MCFLDITGITSNCVVEDFIICYVANILHFLSQSFCFIVLFKRSKGVSRNNNNSDFNRMMSVYYTHNTVHLRGHNFTFGVHDYVYQEDAVFMNLKLCTVVYKLFGTNGFSDICERHTVLNL